MLLLRHDYHIPHCRWYRQTVACVVYFPYNRIPEHEIENGKDEEDLSDSLILMHSLLWDA